MANLKDIVATLAILSAGTLTLTGCEKGETTNPEQVTEGAGAEDGAAEPEASCSGDKEAEASCSGEADAEASCSGDKEADGEADGEASCSGAQ